MDAIIGTPSDNDQAPLTDDGLQDAPASPPDPAPSETGPAETGDEMIDVIVRGPVLGAKMGAVIGVTPRVYADYRRFLKRIG